MAIESCWFQGVHGWATNSTGDWSHDVEFAPSTVLCTAGLASYANSEYSAANAGITLYATKNPETGVAAVNFLPGVASPELVGLTPAIFDHNVTGVVFYFDVEDADEGVIAMALFQIFFWG
jgi:hypothetical protein